jgi:hypothetical protein
MLGSQWLQVRRSDILPDGDRKRSVSPGRCDPVCETDPRRLQASSNVATRFVGQHVGQFLSSTCGVAVATGSEEGIVEAIIERCAGLDVHQATVVVCVLIGEAGRKPCREIRTFSTLTRDLEALRDWLRELGVTHVGMESTGIYWKPVHAILEGHFELIVGNAHHIRNVPGRTTDVKDAEWIADLVRHGLIRPSFVPPPPICDLRDLVRLRRSMSEALTTERNRTLKLGLM